MKQALISKQALLDNINYFKNKVGKAKLMACVKANAYGHGLLTVVTAIKDQVDALMVSEPAAVRTLRKFGFTKEIVLTSCLWTTELIQEMADLKVSLVLFSAQQVDLLAKLKVPVKIWLKVNTGMNRLGVDLVELDLIIKQLQDLSYVKQLVLMSHCANSNAAADDLTKLQTEIFTNLVKKYKLPGCFNNTGGVLHLPHMDLDWVRVGIGLYGLVANYNLKPVMQLQSQVISVVRVNKGSAVGYDSCWVAKTDTQIAIINFGYADGINLALSNSLLVAIAGKILPVVGKISMDILAVDIGLDAKINIGDIAVIVGAHNSWLDISQQLNKSVYELVSQVGYRVDRLLV